MISAWRNHRLLTFFLNDRLFFVFFLRLRKLRGLLDTKLRFSNCVSKIAKASCFLPASCGKLPRAFHGLSEARSLMTLLFCFGGIFLCRLLNHRRDLTVLMRSLQTAKRCGTYPPRYGWLPSPEGFWPSGHLPRRQADRHHDGGQRRRAVPCHWPSGKH